MSEVINIDSIIERLLEGKFFGRFWWINIVLKPVTCIRPKAYIFFTCMRMD